jgi:hypothetical protein
MSYRPPRSWAPTKPSLAGAKPATNENDQTTDLSSTTSPTTTNSDSTTTTQSASVLTPDSLFTSSLMIRNIPKHYSTSDFKTILPSKIPFHPTQVISRTRYDTNYTTFTFNSEYEATLAFLYLKFYTYRQQPSSLTLYRSLSTTQVAIPVVQQNFVFLEPKIQDLIQLDAEAAYSISPQHAAIFTLLLILLFSPSRSKNNNKQSNTQIRQLSILDGCACIGGDTMAMTKMPIFERLYALLQASVLSQSNQIEKVPNNDNNGDKMSNQHLLILLTLLSFIYLFNVLNFFFLL